MHRRNDFFESGYCLFLDAGNVTASGFAFENNHYITEEKCNALRKGKLQRQDIVYTTRGTVGNAAYYNETIPYEHIRINSGMVILRVRKEIASAQFLYQILKHNDYRTYFKRYCTGSAQPQLPISIFSKIELDIPPLKQQEQIAGILSTYDSLIENNQKQIKLLEEAAQRLYREWFVDLRFPGYETARFMDGVPEGWKRKPIADMVGYEIGGGWGEEVPDGKYEVAGYVIRGTDFSSLTNGRYMNIPFRYHTRSNIQARMLQDGDIIFEVSGGSKNEGVARVALIREKLLKQWAAPVICASFCKLVRPVSRKYSQFLFNYFQYLRESGKTEEYDKRSASSIVNYRWKDFLSQETIIVPNDIVFYQHLSITETLYDKIISCSMQIQSAMQSRDRLLPMLMSGELQV